MIQKFLCSRSCAKMLIDYLNAKHAHEKHLSFVALVLPSLLKDLNQEHHSMRYIDIILSNVS